MATHRRGLRPSQWPVRDLLGATADRKSLWDARVGAALAGLLACGAAVTVVVTAGDTAVPEQPAPTVQPPQALPPVATPPAPPAQKMPPAPVPPALVPRPARTAPSVVGDVGRAPGATPRVTAPRAPRSADRAGVHPRRSPAPPGHAPQPTLADQITAVIEQSDRDSTAVGWLLVPVQRPADAAALLELACGSCEPEAGGRHRASDDDEQRPDRHRAGGRHRAPERADDRPESYRLVHDREDDDGDRADHSDRKRVAVDTDGDHAERGGSDRRRYAGPGAGHRDDSDRDDSHWDDGHRDDDRFADRAARQDDADDQQASDEDSDAADQEGDREGDA